MKKELTESEKAVVKAIIENKCFTRKAISKKLCISEHTTATHLGHICLKLDIEHSITGIIYAYLMGEREF